MYPPPWHSPDHYENVVGLSKRHGQCRLVQTGAFSNVKVKLYGIKEKEEVAKEGKTVLCIKYYYNALIYIYNRLLSLFMHLTLL